MSGDDRILSTEDLRKPPYSLDRDPSTIRRMVRKGDIPAPIKTTPGKFGRLGWLESEMKAWHQERLANRQTYEKPAGGPKPPQDERGRFKIKGMHLGEVA